MAQNQNKNAYDLTVLMEDENNSVVESIIKDARGKDIESESSKMNFAYEVEGTEQGFMGVFRFWMPPSSSDELKDGLRSSRKILRHLLLRDNLREKESGKSVEKSQPAPKKQKRQTNSKKQEPETLTNEAIEEKIEEIME